ncbi:hypothetical protein [Acinetobacter seifertii]|uniref:hypothetical protein n=1 Tax=Acinetobacter seifertii TaxID=1530123 RepID=UPI0020C6C07C|nr:hypothetical protein [Acinetobacter seifertii]
MVSYSPGWTIPMLLTFILFFVSAAAIYLACEYFVNGIEWFGKRLNLGATAVGSVLAAFGTALPESAGDLYGRRIWQYSRTKRPWCWCCNGRSIGFSHFGLRRSWSGIDASSQKISSNFA